MRLALHAEWTKLGTMPGTGWLLLAMIALTVAVSAAAASAVRCPAAAACHIDTVKVSFTGIDLGQAVVAVLAVLVISGEYSTGMIRTTLTAMPRRSAVLAAKAAIVTGVVLVTGTITAAGCLLTGRLVLPGHGFTPENGYPPLSLGDGPVLRATAGSVLYLALVALLSLGVATAVRDSAVAIGAVLGVLYLFPIFGQLITSSDLQQWASRFGPMTAGLEIQATTDLHNLPISPWAGLGVLAAWAAVAVLAGALLFQTRDA
jgi:ABC-2 type transport system permease protein